MASLTPDGLQLGQVGVHSLVPAQQHALGQLEHERTGFETRGVEDPAHAIDEAGRAELAGRHVHADVQPAGVLAPPGQIGRGPGQHPGAQRHDLAGLLGQGDELVGLHHAPLRVRPADQGLEPGELPAGERDDRLVGQGERGASLAIMARTSTSLSG
jgi:hypothetical protein